VVVSATWGGGGGDDGGFCKVRGYGAPDEGSTRQGLTPTEMCSGSEAGSYLRLIDLVYHSALGLRGGGVATMAAFAMYEDMERRTKARRDRVCSLLITHSLSLSHTHTLCRTLSHTLDHTLSCDDGGFCEVRRYGTPDRGPTRQGPTPTP